MLPQYESFLDATPEKGAILVEYWWQAPNRLNASQVRGGTKTLQVGTRTSLVFFKRILAADKCWCGSGKTFGKCHRRADDWTYVALDPDRQAYSAVVLLERVFPKINFAHARSHLAHDKRLLAVDYSDMRAEWALPAHPPIVNDIGQLVIGTIDVTPRGLRLETNSEKRLDHIQGIVSQMLGDLGPSTTRRTEPQKAFPMRGHR